MRFPAGLSVPSVSYSRFVFSVRWVTKVGPCAPDLRFPGQTKQTSGYLLLLLVGSITEGKMKLGSSKLSTHLAQ
jgi:hypothetical protein